MGISPGHMILLHLLGPGVYTEYRYRATCIARAAKREHARRASQARPRKSSLRVDGGALSCAER